MIETQLRTVVSEAISAARDAGAFDVDDVPSFDLTRPPRREHGDWSTNAALVLQKQAGRPPREVADAILTRLPERGWIERVEIAGPGFLNFFLSQTWLHDACRCVLDEGDGYGSSPMGAGTSVNVEFVSINPTGPLHIGSARNAAIGDAVARLLEFNGYEVTREYYFNDAGSQMTNFGLSVAARYLQLCGRVGEIPEDGYHGDYVTELAREILAEDGERHADLPPDELGELMRERAYPIVIGWIERSLERFRVSFDVWFSERDLYERGKVDEALERLTERGYVYTHEGATWLRTTEFGDNRDRPVVRSFGAKEPTYLLPDLAYHLDKVERGADEMIVVLGSDHHAHAPSLKAGMAALGVDPERVEVIIYQWVHVLRGGEPLSMSKRAGTFVALDELIDEVGADAARYELLRTSSDNTLYFDVEEVKKRTLQNPVYYVQYGHARISSIFDHAVERGVSEEGEVDWARLTEEAETELMRALSEFGEVVEGATRDRAPHRLTNYGEDLARRFHRFYTDCRVVTDDEALSRARLALCGATRQVLRNTLGLLGVDAPERMERLDVEVTSV